MPCGLSVGGCVRTKEGYGKSKQAYIFKRAVRCHLKADPSTRPVTSRSADLHISTSQKSDAHYTQTSVCLRFRQRNDTTTYPHCRKI